jgi:hypothetical protein
MSVPAGNHVVEEYRGRMRTFMKRCARINQKLSRGSKPYAGLDSWPKNDRLWRDRKLGELREFEKRLPFPKAERAQRIQEIKSEILADITAKRRED